MKIVVMKYGESTFNECYILKGGNEEKMLPISFAFYLIQTEGRNILIDSGCNHEGTFIMTRFCRPIEVLESYGIKPCDITDIVITHHHRDHIEAVSDFPCATIYIQQEEYALGEKYILPQQKVYTFEDELVLAEGLVVKKIGGHSVGSSIVLYSNNGKNYVFCGDECYTKACFEQKIATGASCAPVISEKFIQKYGKGHYEILLSHDPDIVKGKLGYEIVN